MLRSGERVKFTLYLYMRSGDTLLPQCLGSRGVECVTLKVLNVTLLYILQPSFERVLPLSEARHAHELSEKGQVWGKIVLKVV